MLWLYLHAHFNDDFADVAFSYAADMGIVGEEDGEVSWVELEVGGGCVEEVLGIFI